MLHRGTIALLAIGTLAACAKLPPVPKDCQPLEATNKATLPAMMDGGFPETIDIVDGDSGDGFFFAHGEGIVLAPIADVWKALQDPDVVADRRQLKSDSITKSGVDPNAGWSFILQSVTSDANLGFPYLVEWRGYPTAGTDSAPLSGDACGNLTQSGMVAGAPVMNILQDSIVLTTMDANTTDYAAIRHRGDNFSSAMVCQQYVQDVFNSVVAKVHGKPLPTY